MVKVKTSPKQKKSSKNISHVKIEDFSGLIPHDPLENLTDENFIARAIMECLLNNDPEGVMEIVGIYLEALQTARFIEESCIPKSTLYHSLKSKNPTIKTLAKIMHATTVDYGNKGVVKK